MKLPPTYDIENEAFVPTESEMSFRHRAAPFDCDMSEVERELAARTHSCRACCPSRVANVEKPMDCIRFSDIGAFKCVMLKQIEWICSCFRAGLVSCLPAAASSNRDLDRTRNGEGAATIACQISRCALLFYPVAGVSCLPS